LSHRCDRALIGRQYMNIDRKLTPRKEGVYTGFRSEKGGVSVDEDPEIYCSIMRIQRKKLRGALL